MDGKHYEVALAVDARDVDVIAKEIASIGEKPREFFDETPDGTYIIYYWNFICWEGDAVEALLKKLESMRHALYTISEDDEIWKDVAVSDSWGTDEQFYEMLEVSAKVKMFGETKSLEQKDAASMDTFTQIIIDLGDWGTGFPTGVIAHTDSGDVISDYCDDADEFISFLRRYAAKIDEYTEMKFILASGEIEHCTETVNRIRREFELLRPYEMEDLD